MTDFAGPSQRLDKWLFCARIFKTRALAGRTVAGKGVRVTRNGQTSRTDKPNFGIRPGDVLAFARGKDILVLRVEGLAERRGPAAKAQGLYQNLTEGSADAAGRGPHSSAA